MKHSYLLAVCFLLGAMSCSQEKKDAEEEKSVETVLPQSNNEVTVMTLQPSLFTHELISNGKLTARNYVDLRFQTAERVARIYVRNGDRVSKGQKLAELDRFRIDNRLSDARVSLEKARLELQDLLIGQGYALADSAKVPPVTMKLVRLKSGYDQALSAYQLADYEARNAVLTAPFDGIIANLFTKELNTPASSEPFCTVIDPHSLEASFTVLESELPLLSNGDRVEVTPFALTGVKADGRISEINPLVDENGMVKVKAAVRGNGKLFEGMNVRISIHRSVGKQLVIPKESVVLRSGKQVVFTLSEGKALWNYIHTALENASSYTVADGLKEGDVVIVTGNINLAHEAPVKVLQGN